MTDAVLAALVERLSSERGCHTIILYGSRARGDAAPESDYDVMGFSDEAQVLSRITGRWRGALLDVFIYPTARLETPDAAILQVRQGVLLTDRDGAGARFLAALDAVHAKGPEPVADDQKEAIRNWAWKTLARIERGDLEAHYRRADLLTMMLEDYFLLQDRWYPGSKEAWALIKADAPETFAAFEAAFAPGAPHAALEALIARLCGRSAV